MNESGSHEDLSPWIPTPISAFLCQRYTRIYRMPYRKLNLKHMHAKRLGRDEAKRPYVSPLSSTLTGRRPCNSANMSLGWQEWNAPEQMNSTWSVFMLPYWVLTMLPSMMGSRSRCTPSALASGPAISCTQTSPCLPLDWGNLQVEMDWVMLSIIYQRLQLYLRGIFLFATYHNNRHSLMLSVKNRTTHADKMTSSRKPTSESGSRWAHNLVDLVNENNAILLYSVQSVSDNLQIMSSVGTNFALRCLQTPIEIKLACLICWFVDRHMQCELLDWMHWLLAG